jgi:hypothetical protein
MRYSQNTSHVVQTPETLSYSIQDPALQVVVKGFAILIVATEAYYFV